MGQYFVMVNKDKKQYLYPRTFGDGLKLLEFGCSAEGTLTALTLLLRQSNEGGGGDYNGDDKIVGSWAGNRIVIVGDYDKSLLYFLAHKNYEDVSKKMAKVLETEGIKVTPMGEETHNMVEELKNGNV